MSFVIRSSPPFFARHDLGSKVRGANVLFWQGKVEIDL
jgi:hypothetical protein